MSGPNALMPFIQEVGIPQTIVTDNASEEVHGEFEKTCCQFRIRQEQTVPYSPRYNLAELSWYPEMSLSLKGTEMPLVFLR